MNSISFKAGACKLATAALEFAETLPPIDAVRAWMMLFVDYIADKQIIAPALNALVDDPHKVYEASYGQIWEAVRSLVRRAIKSGDIRTPHHRNDRSLSDQKFVHPDEESNSLDRVQFLFGFPKHLVILVAAPARTV